MPFVLRKMEDNLYARTRALIGQDGLDRLRETRAAVVGLGGVGGAAAVSLARSGLGELILIDGDQVVPSNLNRQRVARAENMGRNKADAMAEEIASVAPEVRTTIHGRFLREENLEELIPTDVGYVVDAIDSLRDKVALIKNCHARGIRIISATGAGNRLWADQLCYADLFATAQDPVCRVLRRELRGTVERHPVVVSLEPPRQAEKGVVASMAFVPNAMGLLLANAVALSAAGLVSWEELF